MKGHSSRNECWRKILRRKATEIVEHIRPCLDNCVIKNFIGVYLASSTLEGLEQFDKLWKPVTHFTRVPTKICRAPYHRGRHRDEVLPSFSFSSGSEGLWWPNTKSNFAFFPYCFNICTLAIFFGECCERSKIKTVTYTLLSISQ